MVTYFSPLRVNINPQVGKHISTLTKWPQNAIRGQILQFIHLEHLDVINQHLETLAAAQGDCKEVTTSDSLFYKHVLKMPLYKSDCATIVLCLHFVTIWGVRRKIIGMWKLNICAVESMWELSLLSGGLTQLLDRSSSDCLVTPGRMMPSRGGVNNSFSADKQFYLW